MFRIADGRDAFFQWDLNRQIKVEDSSITELHFCNKTDDCSLVVAVENGVANVPNVLLQTNWDIRVYGYTGDYTKLEKRYKVVARSKPDNYIYEETKIKNYEDLAEQVRYNTSIAETALSVANEARENGKSAQAIAINAAQRSIENRMWIENTITPKLTAHEEQINANAVWINELGQDLIDDAAILYNKAAELETEIDKLNTSVGDIENALAEITALQASYIGGAE